MLIHNGILFSIPPFLALFLYYCLLAFFVNKYPLSTSIGNYNATRKAWVRSVIKNNLDILAVQTLRNWSMSATFLASTASLIVLAILNLLLDYATLLSIAQRINMDSLPESIALQFLRVKLLFLMLALFFSFFSFTLSIRYYNKASFILCIRERHVIPHQVSYAIRIVFNGAFYYRLGMRSYYLILPLSAWLLGNLWLYIAMLILLLVQYWTDYH